MRLSMPPFSALARRLDRRCRAAGLPVGAAVLLAAFPGPSPLAQEPDGAGPLTALTEEQAARFDAPVAAVETQRGDVARVQTFLDTRTGAARGILQRRLELESIDVIEDGLRLARAVAQQREVGSDVDTYVTVAVEMLLANVAVAEIVWDDLSERTEFPEIGQAAAEQAARNFGFTETQGEINRLVGLVAESYQLLQELGAAQTAAESAFADRVRERAINASVYLQMAQDSAAAAGASASAIPGDTEIAARARVADVLVTQTAALLTDVVDVLAEYGDDTATYRQQIVTATGELTPEAFDVSVIGQLVSQWTESTIEAIGEQGPTLLLRALIFVLVIFVFLRLARFTRQLVQSGLERSTGQLSQLLKRMIVSVAANIVIAIGVLIALSQLGISIGPLLAGLGIAGFIVGFALQDTLANFASGLMILFYRPYDVGDIIEVGGILGKVDQMSLVNTTVNTFDNQRIIIPNSTIWGNTIKNVTAETVRRVDMVFGIAYSDDIPKTEKLLREIVAEHEMVLDDPEPTIKLHELGDSSVNFVVRPWTDTVNYWDVYWDITRAVKLRFDEAGISIPFPQRDVHLFTDEAPASRTGDAEIKEKAR